MKLIVVKIDEKLHAAFAALEAAHERICKERKAAAEEINKSVMASFTFRTDIGSAELKTVTDDGFAIVGLYEVSERNDLGELSEFLERGARH